MNPHACRVVLRPRDVFEVFDLTLRFLRAHWLPVTRLGLAMVVLPTLMLSPLLWWTEGAWWILLFPLLLSRPIQAPMTTLVGLLLFDESATVRRALEVVGSRLGTLLGVWLVVAALLTASVMTFGVLSPLLVGVVFVTEAAVLEVVPFGRTLRRSRLLAMGHVGIAVAATLAQAVLILWFAVLFEMSAQMVVGWVLQLGAPFGRVQDGMLTPWMVAGFLSAQMLYAAYRLFLYVDVRTRVEGWDLQVMLRAAALAKGRA